MREDEEEARSLIIYDLRLQQKAPLLCCKYSGGTHTVKAVQLRRVHTKHVVPACYTRVLVCRGRGQMYRTGAEDARGAKPRGVWGNAEAQQGRKKTPSKNNSQNDGTDTGPLHGHARISSPRPCGS